MKKLILTILPILFLSFISFAQNGLMADASNQTSKSHTSNSDASYAGESSSVATFISNNFEYPIEAREAGVSGKVELRILVKENGSAELYSIDGTEDASIIKEFTSLISEMPNWNPAVKNGRAIKQVVKLNMVLKLAPSKLNNFDL